MKRRFAVQVCRQLGEERRRRRQVWKLQPTTCIPRSNSTSSLPLLRSVVEPSSVFAGGIKAGAIVPSLNFGRSKNLFVGNFSPTMQDLRPKLPFLENLAAKLTL